MTIKSDFNKRKSIFTDFWLFSYIFCLKSHTKSGVLVGNKDDSQKSQKKSVCILGLGDTICTFLRQTNKKVPLWNTLNQQRLHLKGRNDCAAGEFINPVFESESKQSGLK